MSGEEGVKWLKAGTKSFTSEAFDDESHSYDGKIVLRESEREKSYERVAEVPVLGIAVVNMGGDHMQAFPTNRRPLKQPLPCGYTYGDVIGKTT